ncbi:MAG: hypothetical protein A2X67_14770 [Ignavibacteria bacterium GWA2_55_11]|nr:MAG: hypothetical protein A2X67_14770 [Ignavibacteria bacterium GWA2_55_11]OGU64455.1 MAG: hypothetical protein A3C56_02005 [Ignavibacteria bacterium RIFCSPHIGHO2_02_FULL_56_12]OGU71147.1 MAG: hypothetical protein A3G43_09360 [Ignavibacteria bacterium RIFCSPLOWO2_12_FULL_56_21]OGU72009.1 MAG: hypothetical protein A3H45_01675 [Ignavibacteria bacterium RIFCSPLOWO2_02_FULL_55_14]
MSALTWTGGTVIREKRHRLAAVTYRGIKVVSFTANVKCRTHFFTTVDRFKAFEEMLLRSLKRFECGSDVYLFMPDHAHLMLRGVTESSDVLRAMKLFKQLSGFWLSQNHPTVRWQKDFYDHIVRDEDETGRHIRYILNNPVKQGLVRHWKDYPFMGSTLLDLGALLRS